MCFHGWKAETLWIRLSAAQIIFPLDDRMHKGQYGKVCVIGGSAEYTGAPYYAAVAALKTGVDLAYVITTEEAAGPIKSYSPELIVLPRLHSSLSVQRLQQRSSTSLTRQEILTESVEYVKSLMPKVDVVILGPGMGGDIDTWWIAMEVIRECKKMEKPITIDADGVRLLQQGDYLRELQGYRQCYLTPNAYEYKILKQAAQKLSSPPQNNALARRIFPGVPPHVAETANDLETFARWLDGPTILLKGAVDIISDGSRVWSCATVGTKKRSGGQGDVLAGVLAVFILWGNKQTVVVGPEDTVSQSLGIDTIMVSTYNACRLTRRAACAAFNANGRGMTSPDILDVLPRIFTEDYEPLMASGGDCNVLGTSNTCESGTEGF